MKKLLAIALCALMMVCAVAPAFAADDALPALFEDADYINLGVIYPDLNTATEGAFTAGEKLYHFSAGDFNKWGIADMQGIMPFAGVEYPVEFEVGDDGKYAFCVSVANYKTVGDVTVKIYDEEDNVLATEVLSPSTDMTEGQIVYFTLAAELELAADEFYTATFSGAKENSANGNSIVCNFYYVATEIAEGGADATEDTSADATEDTSADATEDTSADATEDTSADAADDTTAPETFDVAVIALAVAGASAAAAFVSKKRR